MKKQRKKRKKVKLFISNPAEVFDFFFLLLSFSIFNLKYTIYQFPSSGSYFYLLINKLINFIKAILYA